MVICAINVTIIFGRSLTKTVREIQCLYVTTTNAAAVLTEIFLNYPTQATCDVVANLVSMSVYELNVK